MADEEGKKKSGSTKEAEASKPLSGWIIVIAVVIVAALAFFLFGGPDKIKLGGDQESVAQPSETVAKFDQDTINRVISDKVDKAVSAAVEKALAGVKPASVPVGVYAKAQEVEALATLVARLEKEVKESNARGLEQAMKIKELEVAKVKLAEAEKDLLGGVSIEDSWERLTLKELETGLLYNRSAALKVITNPKGARVQVIGYSGIYADDAAKSPKWGAEVPANKQLTVVASMPGYLDETRTIKLEVGDIVTLDNIILRKGKSKPKGKTGVKKTGPQGPASGKQNLTGKIVVQTPGGRAKDVDLQGAPPAQIPASNYSGDMIDASTIDPTPFIVDNDCSDITKVTAKAKNKQVVFARDLGGTGVFVQMMNKGAKGWKVKFGILQKTGEGAYTVGYLPFCERGLESRDAAIGFLLENGFNFAPGADIRQGYIGLATVPRFALGQ